MPNDTQSSHPLLSCTDRLAVGWQDFLILFGRILLGMDLHAERLAQVRGHARLHQVEPDRPWRPGGVGDLLGYIAAPVEFIGGVCILLGLATRYAAILRSSSSSSRR